MADTHEVMNARLALVTAILLGSASLAAADPPPLDVFLEQRVAEELAADGTSLSRLGVALDVEQVGTQLIVSLVDPATRRAVASTKLDNVPRDREAAVASVTQVAATLVTQLHGAPAPTPAGELRSVLDDERRRREAHEQAEAQYNREAIHFGHLYVANNYNGTTTSISHALIPYQGERRLDAEQFFETVERPDLAERYRARRNFGLGAGIVGLAAMGVGSYWMIAKGTSDLRFCDLDDKFCNAQQERDDAQASRDLKIGIGISLAGATAMLVGTYYLFRANPVSENEAHDLADQHNAKLRQKVFNAQPYAAPGGGGVTVSGRF